jgi:type I restriction enzyme S subunit
MKWEKVRLGDVTDSCLGKMLDKEKNRGEYQLYLSNKDVRWGSFDLEHLDLMKFEEHEEERYGVRYGDLIVCEGGEPGRCAIWKDQIPNMKIQKALHRVRVHEGLDYRFLYYWFLWAGKRGELQQYFTGATIKHMPGDKLKSVIITKPDIETQRQIADVLSAYDDLIENNQKQIKLLEEATQRLYKEWFMDLRFPGYENTEIDNGIPTGWHMGTLGEIVEFRRGKTITKAQVKEGNVPVVAGGLEPAYYHNEANTKAPVITVSGSGANAGFSRMYHEDVFASDCSFADIQGTKSISFVYCFLKANKYQLDALQKGSAQPHVYAKDINAMEILIPQSEMITHYCAKVDVLFNKIGVLQKQMAAASEARDRLLPKLMSGEIEL